MAAWRMQPPAALPRGLVPRGTHHQGRSQRARARSIKECR